MKLVLKVIAGLIFLLVLAVVASIYYLDTIIKEGVVRMGPEVTGTTVELDSVDLSLLSGSAALSGLAIGNPQGFESQNIFSLEHVAVEIDLPTLNQDVIVINRILIEAPEIDYESTESGDNFQAMMDNIAANLGLEASEQESSDTPAKKFIIEEFVLDGGRVAAKHQFLMGKTIDVPLPRLELTEIGRKTNGATAQEAATQIFQQISEAAMSAVTESALMDAARQEFEQIQARAREEVESRIDDVRSEAEQALEDAGIGEEQQDAIRGLLRGFGN